LGVSKYRRDEPGQLVKHKHCPACGTPIDMNKEFCSEKCQAQNRKSSRAKNRTFFMITAGVIAFYVIFILVFHI
jgi:predicted nucleic acid-binding Zn ribbon protein